MSAFSADWLALREPADAAARSVGLTHAIAASLASGQALNILDLGAGTGSNVRFLATHLPARQRWVLVDHDADFLNLVPRLMTSWAAAHGYELIRDGNDRRIHGERLDCRLGTRLADLGTAIDDHTLYEGCDLVTASALLDLVSQRWLDALVTRCAERRAAVLFTLIYDGRMECSPSEPEDDAVRELVNRHQRTDKGFGSALGPAAAAAAQMCFARAGYDVQRDASDWVLESQSAQLQHQLIDGCARAASEIAPDRGGPIEDWRARRLAHLAAGRSRIVVGHTDLGAWPK